MESELKIDYKGYRIEIFQDDNPQDPRENDNLGSMICFHRRYNLGDKHSMSIENLKALIEGKDVISLPLFLYDHSGIAISTRSWVGRAHYAEWDSGQVGYIYVDEAKIRSEYSLLDPSKKIHKDVKDKVLGVLEAEVEGYNLYLSGKCYGYQILKPQECEMCKHIAPNVLDSCWGFLEENLGEDSYVVKEAKGVVDYTIKNREVK